MVELDDPINEDQTNSAFPFPGADAMRWRAFPHALVLGLLLSGSSIAAEADQGRKWAVVIGVNEYLDPKIPDLKYCVADARRVFEVLTKHGGFDPQRVLLIADDQPRAHLRPLRENMEQQIGDWLQHTGPADTVVIHFSGHGFVDETRARGFWPRRIVSRTTCAAPAFRPNGCGRCCGTARRVRSC
jgi:hypothetical protein